MKLRNVTLISEMTELRWAVWILVLLALSMTGGKALELYTGLYPSQREATHCTQMQFDDNWSGWQCVTRPMDPDQPMDQLLHPDWIPDWRPAKRDPAINFRV